MSPKNALLTSRVVLLFGDVAGVQQRKAGPQQRDGDPERQGFPSRSVLLGQLEVLPQYVGGLGGLFRLFVRVFRLKIVKERREVGNEKTRSETDRTATDPNRPSPPRSKQSNAVKGLIHEAKTN